MTTVDAFHELTAPAAAPNERVYAVTAVAPGVWVGKSPIGQAALVVRGEATARPPLVTRHLRADFGAFCQLQQDDSVADETATIIDCTSTEPSVVAHFLLAVSATLTAAGETRAQVDARTALSTLVEVFRAMSKPALTSIQGLWGELFVIANSDDPALLIDAWHVTNQDRHDFTMSTQRVEVKTTTARRRHHRFSHEQLTTSNEENLLVVSLQLESAADGATISDLLHDAADQLRMDGQRRIRLLTGVAAALGEDWEAADQQRYDLAAARRSVQYYDCSALPKLSKELPQAIFDIRYSIDFTDLPNITSELMRRRNGIHRAAWLLH